MYMCGRQIFFPPSMSEPQFVYILPGRAFQLIRDDRYIELCEENEPGATLFLMRRGEEEFSNMYWRVKVDNSALTARLRDIGVDESHILDTLIAATPNARYGIMVADKSIAVEFLCTTHDQLVALPYEIDKSYFASC